MDVTALFNALFRWIHIAAGILWIGLLYFFNFVNGPFAGTMDGETKKKVVPELMPRALYWFRWGAAFTWFTGILLLFIVFYHGGLMYGEQESGINEVGVGLATLALIVIGVFLYDFMAKSGLAKNVKVFAAVCFVLTTLLIYVMCAVAEFGYRAYVIHTGTLFGSIMAFNVWFRIWPSQKKIIAAVKEGTPPDAAMVALAGSRSRQNTYMSVPLVWTMIDAHTSPPADNWLYLPGVILIGFALVYMVFKKATKVKGF